MPVTQRNYDYYTYESDDGTTYNIRAAVEWAAIAAHGLAAATGGAPRYIASKQQSPRRFKYVDATTFRAHSGPVGTATAYSTATLGDTETFFIEGSATGVVYDLVKKIPEKVPVTTVGRQLADHA